MKVSVRVLPLCEIVVNYQGDRNLPQQWHSLKNAAQVSVSSVLKAVVAPYLLYLQQRIKSAKGVLGVAAFPRVNEDSSS